jgi:hypothetical protein
MTEREYIERLLSEIYTSEGIETWMQGRHTLLGDERPVDLLERGEGDRVLAVAQQLADGAYA